MRKSVYSLCFMCTVRCPIKVEVMGNRVIWIEGNSNVAGLGTSLCAKGASAKALLEDPERLRCPMIRKGPRGSGRWQSVSWDEAVDYVAEKLTEIINQHGPQSVVWGERVNLATHVSKTFMRLIGSPNYFSHDSLCKGSVNTACRSLFGYTDAEMGIDYKNTKHIVLYGRNIFESLELRPINFLIRAMENGAKLTYIDPRVTVTATKAHNYFMIRPGTDLAFNYALMNVIIKERLYDANFVEKWVEGFSALEDFIDPYTPEWAEKETSIPAERIIALAREVSQAKPSVIFHYGYRGASHVNETYLRRSILMLNALMGSIEAKGGIFFKKTPSEVGGKAPRKLTDQPDLPKVSGLRFDKVGTDVLPLPDPNHGVAQMLPFAILNEDPYPIKAAFFNRFEPLLSIPDRRLTERAFQKLDLIVTIDIQWSDIAWNSDVVLPESVFLERMDCVQQVNGLKPQLFLRHQAVPPRYDTLPYPIIIKKIADRLGFGKFFPYNTMEELVEWQLEGTGFKIEDFSSKGFVAYTDKEIWWDRENGLKLKTPSKKIEFVSSLLEKAGYPSFLPYEPLIQPPEGRFRLLVGRCAQHTHVSTQNNLYLNELVSENVLWINSREAQKLGISNGDLVEVSSSCGDVYIKAYVTDFIHPEAVFMLHGFGHTSPFASLSYGKGASDAVLQENKSDMVGGSPALDDTIVSVRKANRK